jgi:hypothetical protein
MALLKVTNFDEETLKALSNSVANVDSYLACRTVDYDAKIIEFMMVVACSDMWFKEQTEDSYLKIYINR